MERLGHGAHGGRASFPGVSPSPRPHPVTHPCPVPGEVGGGVGIGVLRPQGIVDVFEILQVGELGDAAGQHLGSEVGVRVGGGMGTRPLRATPSPF